MLAYLQSEKLVCHIFIDAARDTELLGQRQRPLLLWAQLAAGALPLYWFSLSSMAQGGVKGGCCTLHGFASQLMGPELRKPQSSTKSQLANLFSLCLEGTLSLPSWLENISVFSQDILSLCPKAFCCTNILEKMAQSKSCQCLSSENGQKHKRTMENVFSTFLNWFLKVSCNLIK